MMSLEDFLSNTKQIENLNLDIMFGAVPKHLLGDVSRKFAKRKTKNLFYVIFGVFLKQTNQYIVFSSVFKSSKRKIEDDWFSTIMVDSAVFKEKEEVLNFIYDFISNFTTHKRIINEELISLGMTPAPQAFEYLLIWNKSIFDYFNVLIQSENLKSKKFLGLL